MRRPPGTGSITKTNRRNPFRAQFLIGHEYTEEKFISKYYEVGYYATRALAHKALDAYMRNPELFKALHELYKQRKITEDDLLNLNAPPELILESHENEQEESPLTLQQAYELWEDQEYAKPAERQLSDKALKDRQRGIKRCKHLYNLPIKEIIIEQYQDIVDNTTLGRGSMDKFKMTLKTVYDYLEMKRYITKDENIISHLNLKYVTGGYKVEHKPFADDHYDMIMAHTKDAQIQCGKRPLKYFNLQDYLSSVKILLMTGLRISEFISLESTEIHLNKRYFTILESKTDAGERDVPIPKEALPFFEFWLSKGTKYLLTTVDGKPFTYEKYREYWKLIMAYFDVDYLIHDTRYTFAQRLREEEIDKKFIQAIIGHESDDVTDCVYVKKININKLIELVDRVDLSAS